MIAHLVQTCAQWIGLGLFCAACAWLLVEGITAVDRAKRGRAEEDEHRQLMGEARE